MMITTYHNSLIPVVEYEIGGEVQPCVDARELYTWLKSKYQFSDWIKNRLKTYGFVENEDYISFSEISEKPHVGRVRRQFILTLDTAKELSMVENNEQGRTARRYFINCEKALRQANLSLLNQFNKAELELSKFSEMASNAGRMLSVVGKQYKPKAKQKVDELKTKVQPLLI